MKYFFAMIGCLCLLTLSWQQASGAPSEYNGSRNLSKAPAPAYLADTIRVMMRSGPGMGYKISAMLTVGQSIGIMETQGDWTHIKRANGQDGWVLSRFVTMETPNQILLERLQKKYDSVSEKYAALVEEHKTVAEENATLKENLAGNIDKSSTQLEQLTKENEKLFSATQRTNKLFRSFLYGAGVLLIGIFLGSRGKKDSRRYSL